MWTSTYSMRSACFVRLPKRWDEKTMDFEPLSWRRRSNSSTYPMSACCVNRTGKYRIPLLGPEQRWRVFSLETRSNDEISRSYLGSSKISREICLSSDKYLINARALVKRLESAKNMLKNLTEPIFAFHLHSGRFFRCTTHGYYKIRGLNCQIATWY